jgi:hypothetical protein
MKTSIDKAMHFAAQTLGSTLGEAGYPAASRALLGAQDAAGVVAACRNVAARLQILHAPAPFHEACRALEEAATLGIRGDLQELRPAADRLTRALVAASGGRLQEGGR